MNLEISNEMIEQIIQEEVQKQVNKWFSKRSNEYIMRDYVDREIKKLVEIEIGKQGIDVQNIANSLGKELIANKCAESICSEIAYAFAEKFGDYC